MNRIYLFLLVIVLFAGQVSFLRKITRTTLTPLKVKRFISSKRVPIATLLTRTNKELR